MEIELHIPDISFLAERVTQILPLIEESKIILLYGQMGAGKTTFVQECLKQLGLHELEGSPTYSIINEYESEKGKIYHLDLYRLNSRDEIYDLGIEDLLDGKQVCFIEWPEKIENLLYGQYLQLNFELESDFSRKIKIQKKAV